MIVFSLTVMFFCIGMAVYYAVNDAPGMAFIEGMLALVNLICAITMC